MKTEDLPVYRLAYDLTVHVVTCTKNFPKDYKYGLGDKLKNECFVAVVLIFRANSAYIGQNRLKAIADCLERIKTVEMILRLSKDLQLISVKQYSNAIELTHQIGKQLWGWYKASS